MGWDPLPSRLLSPGLSPPAPGVPPALTPPPQCLANGPRGSSQVPARSASICQAGPAGAQRWEESLPCTEGVGSILGQGTGPVCRFDRGWATCSRQPVSVSLPRMLPSSLSEVHLKTWSRPLPRRDPGDDSPGLGGLRPAWHERRGALASRTDSPVGAAVHLLARKGPENSPARAGPHVRAVVPPAPSACDCGLHGARRGAPRAGCGGPGGPYNLHC